MRKVGPPPGRHERQLGAALFILLASFLPTLLWAQGARPEDDIVLRNQNGLAAVVPGANIYTCAGGATVNFSNTPPCTTITVFTDPALTMPITQPLLSDANGNFTEYAVSCATYTLAFTYPNTPGFSKQWTSPCVNFSGPQFGTATIATGIITNLTATNETVTSLTITGTCTGCPGSPPGGAASTLQYNNAGAFGGVAGSIVSGGGVTLQPGASVIPLTVLGTSGQTANVLDVSNQSGGVRPSTAVSIRGHGLGSFTPSGLTSLVDLQQESYATANNGLVLTNRQAVGSGSALSSLQFSLSDTGIASICGGNAVSDANGTYGCFAFDQGPGTTATAAVFGVGGATTVVPFAIQNNTVGSTADLFDISNSSGLVTKFDKNGNETLTGGASTPAVTLTGGGNSLSLVEVGTSAGLISSVASAVIFDRSSSPEIELATPGPVKVGCTISVCTGGGGDGVIQLIGVTSGTAALGVPNAAGTPNQINLPTTTGSAGQLLETNGANPQQTSWVTAFTNCGTIAAGGACANTTSSIGHCTGGIATLSAGTSTITGLSPAFTSSTSYYVVTNDLTTIANPSKGVPLSASSITFTGTGTDSISFVACGT